MQKMRFVHIHIPTSGLFSWNMELLAVSSRQFGMDLCPLHSHVLFFLVSDRSGRKPPAERSAMYIYTNTNTLAVSSTD